MRITSPLVIGCVLMTATLFAQNSQPPTEGGCQIFPADNVWNTRIDSLPVDPNSNTYITTEGGSASPLHPDFGTVYDGAPNGMPYAVVPANQAYVPIVFTAYGDQSDPGPYPVPASAPIEGGSASNGDRHVIVLQSGTCNLYEMFSAYPQADGSWQAASGALFNLNVDGPLRPAGWTSADAAGFAIFPGLVRYDEVQQALAADGVLHHALRFTVQYTAASYIWPARHWASYSTNSAYPPMGQRFRLKASTNIQVYPGTTTPVSATNQVILQTLKTYGMFVADNGASFHVSGVPDPNWDDSDLHLLTYYTANDFEAIDESSLMVDPNSGQTVQATTPVANTFTTYLGPYGSGFQTITGSSAVLPLRGYLPSGAAQFTFLLANLMDTASGNGEYSIIAETDGSGGYTLRLTNNIITSPPWPPFEMTQSTTPTTLPTPFSIGTMQITGYRFTLAGNEFQLDLYVTRSGNFSDQIVILGVNGGNYSYPWATPDGVWSN